MSWKYVLNLQETRDLGLAIITVMRTHYHYKFFVIGNRSVYFYSAGRAFETGLQVSDLF